MDEVKNKIIRSDSYYFQLNKYDKVQVNDWLYNEVLLDEKVYLLIAKGRNEDQYFVVSIWPQPSDINELYNK